MVVVGLAHSDGGSCHFALRSSEPNFLSNGSHDVIVSGRMTLVATRPGAACLDNLVKPHRRPRTHGPT